MKQRFVTLCLMGLFATIIVGCSENGSNVEATGEWKPEKPVEMVAQHVPEVVGTRLLGLYQTQLWNRG
ncbi:hypothetical protein JCM19046_3595 [Bacillus sp. JCM 19046]|nr:hypothetical protein JCM19046_3595 [Bacillus sp. JCM 19046]